MNEKVSALIDGELDELSERRTLQELVRNPELRGTWERYHLIRAAMTRQLGDLEITNITERVSARLDSEVARPAQAPLRFWPLAAGFAAAASVAIIVVLLLQTIQQPVDSAAVPTATTVASTAHNPVPVSAGTPTASGDNDRLNLYLVGHNEFMPTAGMGGMLPYVRVVAHDQDK